MFNSRSQLLSDNVDKSLFKIILGVITGSFWAISAVLLFIDAIVNDLSTITRGLSGTQISSTFIIDYIDDLLTPVINQLIYTEQIITLCINILGILSVLMIGLALRTKSEAKIWKYIFLAGIVQVFVYSLVVTILKFVLIGGASGVLALVSTILSLTAGILYFTVLPKDDIKAGLILISVPIAYLGGTVVAVLLLLFIVSVLYSLILGKPIFPA